MKKGIWKKRLLAATLLVIAMVGLVELQKWMKNRVPECVNGICELPDEKAGAIVGPQSVPLLLPASQAEHKPLPRLIDFGAGSCATCKMMTTVLDELASEYTNRLTIQIVDTREDKETTADYSIRMIPTQIFLDANGNELFRHEGFISKEDILKKWAELGVEL